MSNRTNSGRPDSYTLGNVEAGNPCCSPVPQLKVDKLSIRYGARTVLNDVSLEIYRGCITALIGPSGCGKTSFLSALNRLTDLIPGAQVNGRVEIDGRDIFDPDMDVTMLRRRIGMIFQKPNPFPLSVRRNLELPLKEYGFVNRKVLNMKIESALDQVGLLDEVKDRLDSPALLLSGGQQQRLCIARALVLEPEILLMDEPCSALDPMASVVVETLIERLCHRYTVVVVTHNLAQARRIANYAGFFWMTNNTGKLVEFGRSQNLFDTPKHKLTAAYVSGDAG